MHEELKFKDKIQRLLGKYFSRMGEEDPPLKYPKHMTVWWDKGGFQRRGEWHTVWRQPNGRFAKKPEKGERAKNLGLAK